jgi:hypothetical protein
MVSCFSSSFKKPSRLFSRPVNYYQSLYQEKKTMKKFMDAGFLLSTKTAHELYHEAAAEEPRFDYHCHLDPVEIAENRRFSNLAEVWLGGIIISGGLCGQTGWRSGLLPGTPTLTINF